jgi:hypothetical protein
MLGLFLALIPAGGEPDESPPDSDKNPPKDLP